MANKEHESILKTNVEGWNDWRKNNPFVRPDLSDTDLYGLDLFVEPFKEDAPTIELGSHTFGLDLRGTDFRGANLAESNIVNANLTFADFEDANFSKAFLTRNNFSYANLNSSDFSAARFWHNLF